MRLANDIIPANATREQLERMGHAGETADEILAVQAFIRERERVVAAGEKLSPPYLAYAAGLIDGSELLERIHPAGGSRV
jgi:hypothetical protein